MIEILKQVFTAEFLIWLAAVTVLGFGFGFFVSRWQSREMYREMKKWRREEDNE